MVTCSEYIFNNIDEALKYILETEQRALWLRNNTIEAKGIRIK